MIVDGKTIPVKQCMGDNEEINVEKINVDLEEQIGAANTAYRVKRFLGILTVVFSFFFSLLSEIVSSFQPKKIQRIHDSK